MTLPLTWQLANVASRVMQHATSLFENLGVVEDGMQAITQPIPRKIKIEKEVAIEHGLIEFRNATFGYDASALILDGVDLRITPGDRVGLIGESGVGKTTLFHLITRLFDLNSGSILIDGTDITEIDADYLRRHIAVVVQDSHLLNRSIRDNIRLGKPDASDAEVWDAARRGQAGAFISELADDLGNKGLDAFAGDRGVKLSGGQKQRIMIARALLKNPKIILLDEVTSGLDENADWAIQQELVKTFEGRTIVSISHHTSTMATMNRFIRLRKGRLEEITRTGFYVSAESSLRERK
jgi:ATP-binding cassette subfamily B multidrug efflux pump